MAQDENVEVPHIDQLKAYEVGAKVYDHIIALQSGSATVANLYLLITGALWVAIGTDQLKLPRYAAVLVLRFHLIGSVATLQITASNTNAIKLRFAFLKDFGDKYHHDIEKIGKNSFVKTYGGRDTFKARYARWGGQTILWYLIPIAGFAGSCYFLVRTIRV